MTACNLLQTSLSHRFCHKDETKGGIFITTSVHGRSKFSGCAFDKASFAARSASSFPLISLWLGIQQNVIYSLSDNIPDMSVYMWQKSKYFCLTSLNRLFKTVEEVEDLSNSDKVKSTVAGSESQMGTSGILLIAISPTSNFASFNNFLQFIQKESVAESVCV